MSDEQRSRLERLAASPETEVNTSDIPEILGWSGAVRGGLSKIRTEAVTLRLDADVLAWFRDHATDASGYKNEINRVLRRHVAASGGEFA